MLNFGALFEQATELLSSANLGDVQQQLSDAGLDLSTLSDLAPEDASQLLERAGLDPEIMNSGVLDQILGETDAEG
ncbi:MAG: hypothetical protein AAFR28_02400 [Pseudomonadota bacterium]